MIGLYARHGHDQATLEEEPVKLDYRPLVIVLSGCLTEAGIAVHDCDGPGRPAGGCSLTVKPQPHDQPGGVMVSGPAQIPSVTSAPTVTFHGYETVQSTVTVALWAILDSFDFPTQSFGMNEIPLVTGMRLVVVPALRPFQQKTSPAWTPRASRRGRLCDVAVIDDEGRLGRPCALCAGRFAALHSPPWGPPQ